MIQGFKILCRAGLRSHSQIHPRYSSSAIKTEWKNRRNLIFDSEKERQANDVGRIEKIKVEFLPTSGLSENVPMAMNRNLSTPNDCAKHISEGVHRTAALALVNGEPWDMHRPFVTDCSVKLLTMEMPRESSALNTAFWRTCSFVLGAMIESVFKDDIQLYLHSFPPPNVYSGSYVYDVVLDLPEWKPTNAELRALSAQFVKLTNDELPVERLEISEELALDMFQDNPFKSKQIPDIAKSNVKNSVTVYRIGEHIDLSKGPMVGNTNIIGKSTITAVHKIDSEETDRMYRFQGVSLARGMYLNHFAYGLLEERARKLNISAWMPSKIHEEMDERRDQKDSFAAKN